jgi:F420 biosynthesis protein FbiB-like protein
MVVVYASIMGRRSIRQFNRQPVPRALVEKVLQAATYAPSAHNRQPWRFIVLGQDTQALAEAMAEELEAARSADGDDPEEIMEDVTGSINRIVQAPVAILVLMTMEDMDQYPDDKRSNAESVMAVQSVAMAAQNLMLAAYSEGLGSCWLCAPLFAAKSVRSVLQIPEHWLPQGLILLGYPAHSPSEKARRSLAEVVQWR